VDRIVGTPWRHASVLLHAVALALATFAGNARLARAQSPADVRPEVVRHEACRLGATASCAEWARGEWGFGRWVALQAGCDLGLSASCAQLARVRRGQRVELAYVPLPRPPDGGATPWLLGASADGSTLFLQDGTQLIAADARSGRWLAQTRPGPAHERLGDDRIHIAGSALVFSREQLGAAGEPARYLLRRIAADGDSGWFALPRGIPSALQMDGEGRVLLAVHHIAAGALPPRAVAQRHDLRTGRPIGPALHSSLPHVALSALSPDGRWVALSDEREVELWRADSAFAQQRAALAPMELRFSRDSSLLWVQSERQITSLSVSDGVLRPVNAPGSFQQLKLLSDTGVIWRQDRDGTSLIDYAGEALVSGLQPQDLRRRTLVELGAQRVIWASLEDLGLIRIELPGARSPEGQAAGVPGTRELEWLNALSYPLPDQPLETKQPARGAKKAKP
jgi:hypothetical protein